MAWVLLRQKAMLHDALSPADRSQVLRFAASFIWADDVVAEPERHFLDDLARELDIDDPSEVAQLLAHPPEVDPAEVPPSIADLVRKTALRAIAADGRVHPVEMAMFELLDDLLPRLDDDEDEAPDLAIDRRSDDVEDGWVVPIGAEVERTSGGRCPS